MDGETFEVYLYYWDDRDGPHWQGWWFAPDAVGSERFLAFSNGAASSPEQCQSWRGGERSLTLRVARLEDGEVMGVRAPGLGFEGAYVRDDAHPHDHQGRPVFRRTRDLESAEISRIDAEVATDTGVAVGVPLVAAGLPAADAVSALAWVQSGELPAVPPAVGAAEGDELGAATVGTVVVGSALRMSLRVESRADLEQLVTKGASERLSVPQLADELSPLPVGWVVAARTAETTTRSVRDHVLHAADNLDQGLPEAYRELPQVQEQIRRLRQLVEACGFDLCVWDGAEG